MTTKKAMIVAICFLSLAVALQLAILVLTLRVHGR